jgi:plastocyanin
MKKLLIVSTFTIAIVVLSAGCRPTRADPGPITAEITVVTAEFRFIPDTLTLKTGDRVRLTLDNSAGKLPHDLKQADLKINVVAQPGQKAVVEFVAAKTGTFDFICSVAGHQAAGMVGKVIVEP